MTSTATTRRPAGRRRRIAAIAAAVLVPLAFAGLFVGSIGQADDAATRAIPAAVVNSDTLITQTAADGTETPVFAGRQLVTELTASNSEGFDWTITNAADAKKMLESGEVYAVLTVPSDFSSSILSIQGKDPVKADLRIATDDAHSYLTPIVAESVGQSMTTTFGRTITETYLSGLYTSLGDLGSSLGTAADGATGLADGATKLGSGLTSLAEGATSAQTGAATLSSGVATYTGGVGSLSSGLARLNNGAAGLTQVSQGVTQYTGGVSQLSAAIAAETAKLTDADPLNDPAAIGTLTALSGQLATTAAGGAGLASQASTAISGIQGGISSSASGAARLAAGSGSLTSGATSLASGLGSLSTGATDASTGATTLATGATDLASGLRTGADQVPAADGAAQSKAAGVVAEPVTLTVDQANKVEGLGQMISTFLVPLGLWLGALATFLVLGRASASALASSAGDGRLLGRLLGRASAIAVAQALLLVAMLHVAVGVDWSLLPATLSFAVVMALAFTAIHSLLTLAFGRGGLVVSLLLLAVQVTSTGGLYPVDLLAAPFRVISPLLPLTAAVDGMQSIVSGGGGWAVPLIILVVFGGVSALLSIVAMRRVRTVRDVSPVLTRA